jgi:hypothetical protein
MIISKISGLNNTAFGNVAAPVVQYLTDMDIAAKANSMVEKIIPSETSDGFGEYFGGQTALGNFVAGGEGESYPENDFQDDYGKTILNDVTWRNKFDVTLEMVEDVKMGKIKTEASAFVDSYHNTLEEYAGDFLTKAIATTQTFGGKTFNIACADTKALFATDHPYSQADSRTQSTLFNAEFSYENLSIVEAIGSDIRDTIGRKINFKYDTIILPFSTRADALQLQKVLETLNGDGKPTTADRSGNYHAGRWNVIWWNFLGAPAGMTSGKSWWMLADSNYVKKYKPFVLQKRKDLTVNSYVEQGTDTNVWKGRARHKLDTAQNYRGILACIPGLGTSIAT